MAFKLTKKAYAKNFICETLIFTTPKVTQALIE